MKNKVYILLIILPALFSGCSGSRKYFKAAERMEKQGLVSEAAEYYLESLQRKPTNVEARIKLKEVGQKHLSNLASEFFRNYNTQQLEATLETFERLKAFNEKSSALDIKLDYPKTYDEDYQKTVETYCIKNYNKAHDLVNQRKYNEAVGYIRNVEKYNRSYKNISQLSVIATCEPLYQSAVSSLENKNYASAQSFLEGIRQKTENYKDSKDLLELAAAQQTKSFILFGPNTSAAGGEGDIEEYLYSNFNQVALQRSTALKVINNTPFQNTSRGPDLNSNTEVDLVQAIRKASAADYFYVFDVSGKREYNSGFNRNAMRGFREVRTRKNDTVEVVEYKAFDYNVVKAQRSFSYDFKYKIINAYTNQVVSTQVQSLRSQDAVEYQEFQQAFKGNTSILYPYNPSQTAPAQRSYLNSWRSMFTARSDLKLMEELKADVYNQNIRLFLNSMNAMK